MGLCLHNTLTQRLEPFEPLVPGQVRMYSCGITAYDLCHIGHARSALAFEVVRRYLERSGYAVTFVRNFTDVDDKIIARAAEQGRSWRAVAEEFIGAFSADMAALGLRPATVEPRATDHIPEMLTLIRHLLDQGLAYAAGGDVYYAVRRFPAYGKLSRRSPDELLAGARIEVNERKRDPLDFALWKASRPGEPAWESPWGPGRPGWHIECSAMAGRYLGVSFDIHAGGEDLIFPHHENEIAQSEGAWARPLARYWLHNGFVTVNGEKMAKSQGNFVTIREALGHVSPEALKLLLLSTNYRSPLDYTAAAVLEKARALAGIRELLRGVETLGLEAGSAGPPPAGDPPGEAEFSAAMDDDFNTARATAVLFDLVREGNRLLQERPAAGAGVAPLARLQAIAAQLQRLGRVLALELTSDLTLARRLDQVRLTRGAAEALGELRGLLAGAGAAPDPGPLGELLVELLALREAARRERNWGAADEIRKGMAALEVRIEDGRSVTSAVAVPTPEGGRSSVAVSLVKS